MRSPRDISFFIPRDAAAAVWVSRRYAFQGAALFLPFLIIFTLILPTSRHDFVLRNRNFYTIKPVPPRYFPTWPYRALPESELRTKFGTVKLY